MILPAIVASQRTHLDTLAKDWLDAGASSFSIWKDGVVLASWPEEPVDETACLIEAIQVNAVKIGELRITGLHSASDCQRLQAQAGLIAQIARLERDLNSMGADLIDTQDQLLALYNLTQATRNYLDTEELLARLAFETARLVKAEAAFFLIHMKGRSPIIQHYPQPILSDEALHHYIKLMKESQHEFLFSRGSSDQAPGIRNMLVVPIKVRDAETAVMGMLNKFDADFNSPDIKLAGAIAEFTGAQIENVIMHQMNTEQARLQTEMELAQRIQIHLLPQEPPGIAGLDLWAASWPASRVGGDFYDFIIGANQPFTFTVGDISGKGIPAALLMAMTRTVIRTKTKVMPMPSPQVVMGRSNQELYEDFTKLSMFATVFVGQYDSVNRQLLYANAGHSPVIYCPAGGEARLLRADGTPMGILPTSLSKDQWIDFQPGDVLVVATDGFSEARNAQDKEFGYDRLTLLVQSLAHKPARVIAENIYKTVSDFSNGMSQADDQTLVVLKGVGA